MVLAVLVALTAVPLAAPGLPDSAPLPLPTPTGGRGELHEGGAFTCDFGLPPDTPMEDVAPTIERDRMYMAERPGMSFKNIPFVPAPQDGVLYTGGRYLFDTQEAAMDYLGWVREAFALDDVLFLERPMFLDPECFAWATIGAHEWGDVRSAQVVLPTERWEVPAGVQPELEKRWPDVRDAAAARGHSAVWLLHDEAHGVASLVYFGDRLVAGQTAVHPIPSLAPLALAPPLGHDVFADTGWTLGFDRTHFVLTTWFPFLLGDHGEAALWPSSPPLPEPTTMDGVCEVSRGENADNAPDDCLPTCGNAVADVGETTRDCPGDVRPHWTAIP